MRIVVELKRGEIAEVVLNNLYKHTQLQTTFGVIMLAIVGGRPRCCPCVDLIEQFVEFRRDVVRRRIAVRAAEGRGARAHPRGPEDRPRPPRRGDHAHPRLADARRGPRGPDGRSSRSRQIQAQADPRHAAAAAHRPRAREDRRGAGRDAEDHRAVAGHPRERPPADADRRRRAARHPAEVRRRPPHDDRRRDRRVPDRGPDRRGGHGDHGRPTPATSSGPRSPATGTSGGAARGASACGCATRTSSGTSSSRPRTPTS